MKTKLSAVIVLALLLPGCPGERRNPCELIDQKCAKEVQQCLKDLIPRDKTHCNYHPCRLEVMFCRNHGHGFNDENQK